MATTVIAAIQAKVSGLTAANFPALTIPKLYLSDTPLTGAAGQQVYPPYGVLISKPGSEEFMFEEVAIEEWPVTLELYYDTLADAETALLAIRFNGQSPASLGGLDWGTLPALTGVTLIEVEPTSNARRGFAGVGKQGQRVHVVSKDYTVRVEVS